MIRDDVMFVGQRKDWFLVKFIGNKDEIKLQEEEVRKHKWVAFEELKDHFNFPNQFVDYTKAINQLLNDSH